MPSLLQILTTRINSCESTDLFSGGNGIASWFFSLIKFFCHQNVKWGNLKGYNTLCDGHVAIDFSFWLQYSTMYMTQYGHHCKSKKWCMLNLLGIHQIIDIQVGPTVVVVVVYQKIFMHVGFKDIPELVQHYKQRQQFSRTSGNNHKNPSTKCYSVCTCWYMLVSKNCILLLSAMVSQCKRSMKIWSLSYQIWSANERKCKHAYIWLQGICS